MVLRIVRFLVSERSEAAFMQHMRDLAQRSIGSVEGLVELRLVRTVEKGRVVALGMSLWRDWESLQGFYGEQIEAPLLVDPYGEWTESATVEHFEYVFTLQAEGFGGGAPLLFA